jgi:CRP-like cAMP-binding protein
MTTSVPRTSRTVQFAAILARTDLFGGLADRTRAELAESCHARSYPAGERIFARGDAGSAMYVVVQGAVALSISSADGGEVILDVLRPLSAFAELSLIDNGPRIATATAQHASTLISVPGSAVNRLLHAEPAFALAMLTRLAQLVRVVDDHLVDRTVLDLRTRVIKYLLSATRTTVRRSGQLSGTPAELEVHLAVSQTELARLVGGSRQKVNRVIVDLERCGAIRREGTHVVAIRPTALDPA